MSFGGVIEGVLGERIERVAVAAGIERIRHQHGVVERRDLDVALREHQPGEFQIVADLQHAGICEQWFERIERRAFGNLVGRPIAAEQAAALAVAALPVR